MEQLCFIELYVSAMEYVYTDAGAMVSRFSAIGTGNVRDFVCGSCLAQSVLSQGPILDER